MDTATVVTAVAAAADDDTTVVVTTALEATTDEVEGRFGGSCDFAPYSMYCKNTQTSNHYQICKRQSMDK